MNSDGPAADRSAPGPLDGLTLLRYGHTYDTGGGIEQYLVDLNRSLLERSAFTTIQVQLTSDPRAVGEVEANLGKGQLRRVSLFVEKTSHEQAVAGSAASPAAQVKHRVVDGLLRVPGVFSLVRPALKRRKIPRRDGEPANAGETVRALHRRYKADLICLHSAGDADVSEILAVAAESKIPVVYVHHFSNDRLAGVSMRTQLDQMNGVAGVSGADIPSFLRARFRNVSDGIDTEFFQRNRAQPVGRAYEAPLIFLPARITPTKGQADLIRAAGELKRRGLKFHVAFAGRTDSPAFFEELKGMIEAEGVADRVEFVGQHNPSGLRDWYGAASLLVFPTRHHEGLPRILLEAQAMEVTPIVYNSGGSAGGLKPGETGFLLEPGDLKGMIEAIATLLNDATRRDAMGKAGRRLVESQFSLGALAERHESFYRATLAAAKAE